MTQKYSTDARKFRLAGAAALLVIFGGANAQERTQQSDAERQPAEDAQQSEFQKLDQSGLDGMTLGELLRKSRAENPALKDRAVEEALAEALQERVQQERPTLQRPDFQRPAIEEIDTDRLRLAESDDEPTKDGAALIQFDEILGDPIASDTSLNDQYVESHAVRFGRGATIQTCRQVTFDATRSVAPSPCAYPRAASGQNAAHYDLRGGQALRLDFTQPVSALSVKVNPTGGQLDEAFQMRLAGFDANGEQIASQVLDFFWRQDAFTWPTSINLATKEGRMTRVTMEMRQPRRANQSVRFLFDDLSFEYAPELATPLFDALNEQQRPPRIVSPEIVQSPESNVRRELRLYPPATRIRTAIDWEAAKQTVAEQEARGLRAAPLSDMRAVDVAELPVILPSRADAGTLSVAGQADSYHADFDRDGRGYSIYGTRVLTSIRPAQGATQPTTNLRFTELEYGLSATFSLYGASYNVTRYCLNDSAEEDPACYDRDELGDMAAEMVVVIGEAGERAP